MFDASIFLILKPIMLIDIFLMWNLKRYKTFDVFGIFDYTLSLFLLYHQKDFYNDLLHTLFSFLFFFWKISIIISSMLSFFFFIFWRYFFCLILMAVFHLFVFARFIYLSNIHYYISRRRHIISIFYLTYLHKAFS